MLEVRVFTEYVYDLLRRETCTGACSFHLLDAEFREQPASCPPRHIGSPISSPFLKLDASVRGTGSRQPFSES